MAKEGPSHCSGRGITRTCPYVHTRNKELPSHQNSFTSWTTRSHSLGVNPTETSLAYKYAIISKFRWISKALLPSSSLSLL
jgi:hypothetical protein